MNEKIKQELFMIYVLGSQELAWSFMKLHKINDQYSKYLFESINRWSRGSQSQSNMIAESLAIYKNINGLSYPLAIHKSQLTDFYGNTDGRKYAHGGIDIWAKEGTPIIAGGNGIVLEKWGNGERKDWRRVYGNYIIVDFGSVVAWFCHCHELKVNAGDIIKQDQIIATVGNTTGIIGGSSGPHLHLAIWNSGAAKHRNPLRIKD